MTRPAYYRDLAPKLFEKGWVNLLPLGVFADGRQAPDPKSCMLKGWSRAADTPLTEARLASCLRRFPYAGIGCAFKPIYNVAAIDIDILDREKLAKVRDVAWATLPKPMSRFQRIGRKPKVMIFYSGDIKSSKRPGINIETFGSSGQTVMFQTHPVTGEPYSWPFLSPLEHGPRELPRITQDEIDSFLEGVAAEIGQRGADGRPIGRDDVFATWRAERQFGGADAARAQLQRVQRGERHMTVTSVVGWLVSRGLPVEAIVEFVDENFPENMRDRRFNPEAEAAQAAHDAIAKFYPSNKDWNV